MAHTSYRDHLIISIPDQKTDGKRWRPYSTVIWIDAKGFHYHEFNNLRKSFNSEDEARDYGFKVARGWIENKF